MTSASGAIRLMSPVRTRARTDLDEGGDAGRGHPLDGADPVDAGRQVLDELGPAGLGGLDRAAVLVGQERDVRVVEGDPGQRLAHAVGRLGHQRGVRRDRDRQDDGALGAERLGELRAGLDGRALARDDDLARGVAVGDDEDAVLRGRVDQLGEPRIVEADQRRHRAVATLPRRLHQAAALADEPDAVGEVEGAGRDERRVLAHRVTGDERRASAPRGPRRPSARAAPPGSRSMRPGSPAGRSRSGRGDRPGRPRPAR